MIATPSSRLSTKWRSPCSANSCARCSKRPTRSEEHTSELQSLMRISYAVFCLKKKIDQLSTSLIVLTYLNHWSIQGRSTTYLYTPQLMQLTPRNSTL